MSGCAAFLNPVLEHPVAPAAPGAPAITEDYLGQEARALAAEVIAEFYGDWRYRDPVLKRRTKDPGHPLPPDFQKVILGADGLQVLLFHQLSREPNKRYVGILGRSIVLVEERLRPFFPEGRPSFERQLQEERRLPKYSDSAGVPVTQLFGEIEEEDRVYLIKSYDAGPTLETLRELRSKGQISSTEWAQALWSYREFQQKLKAIEAHIVFDESSAAYFEGQWKLIRF